MYIDRWQNGQAMRSLDVPKSSSIFSPRFKVKFFLMCQYILRTGSAEIVKTTFFTCNRVSVGDTPTKIF
jgi:hypothetical protein